MIITENYNELKEYDCRDYNGQDRYNPAYHTQRISEIIEKAIVDVRKEGLCVYLNEQGDIVVANTTSKEFSTVNYSEIFDVYNDERNL